MTFDFAKKSYLAAIGALLLIPFAAVGGGMTAVAINPEWALKTAHYTRNFHILDGIKKLVMMGTAASCAFLWLTMIYLLIRSKRRSPWWLAAAPFGPLGLTVVCMLDDKEPAPGDAHQRAVQSRGWPLRAASEAAFFFAAWWLAGTAVWAYQMLQVYLESYNTGVSVQQILDVRNASSGMWAFTEGMEEMFLVSMIYLFWPVGYSLAARLLKR